MINYLNGKRLVFLFIFPPLLMVLLIANSGYLEAWNFLQIPSAYPPFYDFRILPAIILSDANGLNPQINNPWDPSQRLLNYPLIWIQIAKFLN